MLEEVLQIKLKSNEGNVVDAQLILYEEAPENEEFVKIILKYEEQSYESTSDNYFDALNNLREILEKKSLQILCRGACKNVYPSAMQLNMRSGRNAYLLTMHKQARQKDVVDIFAPSNVDECFSVVEQKQFFNLWIESLEG